MREETGAVRGTGASAPDTRCDLRPRQGRGKGVAAGWVYVQGEAVLGGAGSARLAISAPSHAVPRRCRPPSHTHTHTHTLFALPGLATTAIVALSARVLVRLAAVGAKKVTLVAGLLTAAVSAASAAIRSARGFVTLRYARALKMLRAGGWGGGEGGEGGDKWELGRVDSR